MTAPTASASASASAPDATLGPFAELRGRSLDGIPKEQVDPHRLPAVAGDVAARVDRLYAERAKALVDARLAPDGSAIFARGGGGAPRVVRIDAPLAAPVDDVEGRLVGVTRDGSRVVTRAGPRRADGVVTGPTSLVVVDASGAHTVFAADEQTPSFDVAASPSGFFFSTRNVGETATVLRFWEPMTSSTKRVWDDPSGGRVIDARGGAILLGRPGALRVVDPGANAGWDVAPCAEAPPDGTMGHARFAESEAVVVFRTAGDRPILCAAKAGTSARVAGAAPGDVDAIDVHPTKKRVLYTTAVAGRRSLHVAADASDDAPLPGVPAGDVALGQSSADEQRTLFALESGSAPATTYVYDWTTKTSTLWYAPSVGRGAEPKDLACTTEAGPITLVVRRPAACERPEARCPVVVDLNDARARPYSAAVRIFEDAGYVSIVADASASGPDTLRDVARCAREVAAGSKVGAWGSGRGGYIALLAATRDAGLFDAVAAVGAPPFIEGPISSAMAGLENAPEDARRRASPATYADRVRAPLLLVDFENSGHAIGDTFAFTGDLVSRGADVTMFVVARADTADVAERGTAVGAVLTFFDRTLKPSP